MPQITTPAIVLHAFPYGETSKIVRFATRDHGVLSAVAKGAHRGKSRFGARLQLLSEGTVRMYVKPNRDLHTLAEFEVTHQRQHLATDLRRYAAAAALGEVVMRLSPEAPLPETYEILRESLDWLVTCEPGEVSIVALAAMWSVIASFGFTPSIDACAVDGEPLATNGAAFSIADGGFLCSRCSARREGARLTESDRDALRAFVHGTLPHDPVDRAHAAAHRRLVVRFVHTHVAEGRDLNALQFWETQS